LLVISTDHLPSGNHPILGIHPRILLRSARHWSENNERAKMLYLLEDRPVLYLPLVLFDDHLPSSSFLRRPDGRFPEDGDEASQNAMRRRGALQP
jgi:hypothetical protein